MSGKIKIFCLTVMCMFILAGCGSQNTDYIKENAQLKTEIESLKQQVAASNNKLKQQEELYELRNNLDIDLHNTLRDLIKGDYKSVQQNLAPSMRIDDNKLVSTTSSGDQEFVIPDHLMNLRQRTFMKNKGTYSAIYEIYDAGYLSGNRYDDRTYTLNADYQQINGKWKLSSLMIDE